MSEDKELRATVEQVYALRAEVVSLKQTLEAEKGCHVQDMKHLVERTRERDNANLQLSDWRKGFKIIARMQTRNHSLGDAQKVAAMALDEKPEKQMDVRKEHAFGICNEPTCPECRAAADHGLTGE